MSTSPSSDSAHADLAYIKAVAVRTERRIDPHAFHFVHWGAIVLVWFPLANAFEQRGNLTAYALTGAAALLLGILLSVWGERRLAATPRLEADNTFIGDQVGLVAALCVGAGIVLSALGPAFQFIAGRDVPTVWGFAYATMAAMTGVVYRREFLWAGAAIFLGAVLAMAFPQWNGYILGPVMGLGLIIPALAAERRGKRLQADV